MSRKAAVIAFELVDESAESSNSAIVADLLKWFNEEVLPAPWVKKVRVVSVQKSEAEQRNVVG
ncbi:MAG: hypothetical protein NWE99_10340 [Candidatus Bathyarchaeota archaeon]|nr:hypothetical protein [Candidatus Bathyarchaeota archaeon]